MQHKKTNSFLHLLDYKSLHPRTRNTIVLFLLFLISLFFLPRQGKVTVIGWIQIILIIILYASFATLVLSNPTINFYWKNSIAFGFFFLICWLFVKYSNAKWNQFFTVFFNFNVMQKVDPMSTGSSISNWILMIRGLLTTLRIFFFSAVFSTCVGLIIAIIRFLINDKVLNSVLILFVDFCRSMPILVLLIIIYSALPYTGIILSPNLSGIMTLGLVEGAYMSEIFRSGLNSIHAVQTEASRALGLSGWQTLRYVILPQSIKVIIPPYTSSLVGLMKGTALCSTITIFEMIKTAQQIQAWYASPTPVIVATIGYLILLLPLTSLSSKLEQQLTKK